MQNCYCWAEYPMVKKLNLLYTWLIETKNIKMEFQIVILLLFLITLINSLYVL